MKTAKGTLGAMGLALLLGGCATLSEDGGFSAVADTLSDELVATPAVIRTAEDADIANSYVSSMLAQPLTSDMAVRIALANHRGLQAAYNALGMAEADMVSASLPPAPTISVARIATGGISTEIERQVLVNILALATLKKRSEIAKERFRQAQLAAALETLNVASQARRSYYRVAAANRIVALLEKAKLSANAASELIAELGKTGGATRIEQAREQAFYAEVTAQLARARLARDGERENLVRALGLWGDQERALKLPGVLPGLPSRPAPQADVETEALRRRIDLQISRIELDVLARSYGLEQATRYVDLVELIGMSSTERETVMSGGVTEVEKTHSEGIEVEFQIPVFDFGKTRVRRARENYLMAVNRLAAAGVDARSQARGAYRAYQATYDIARLYRDEVVPLRQIVADESLLRYNGMISDVTDLIADVRAGVQANVAATEALRDYWIAAVDLHTALAGGAAGAGISATAMATGPAEAAGAGH